jgi:thiol-disulfide isomerase/thioredoxin
VAFYWQAGFHEHTSNYKRIMRTVALIVFATLLNLSGAFAAESGPLQPGAAAPDFVSKDPTGQEIRLGNIKNKIVVLDFWATWCGPCMKSMPHVQEVAKKFKDQDVVVLAVCTSDTRANFTKWVQAKRAVHPNISFTCDPNERGSATYDQRAAQKLYGVEGIPTQFVIGKDGKIAATFVGYQEGDDRLGKALAKLVK